MSRRRVFIIAASLLAVAVAVVRVAQVSRSVGNVTESAHGVVVAPAQPVPPLPPPPAEVKEPAKPAVGRIPLCAGCAPKLTASAEQSARWDCAQNGGTWIGGGCLHVGNSGAVGGSDFHGPQTPPPQVDRQDGSGGAGAPMANKPAERETTAGEQLQQAQMEAAQAQAVAVQRQLEAASQANSAAARSQTSVDFDEAIIRGELKKPDTGAPSSSPNVSVITGGFGDPTGQPRATPALAPVERYPNIEAPNTVTAGQEIAVQVSLTAEQISPETKILSGVQSAGKLQLPMAERERQWTLTVNLTVPGMDITRGGTNTAEISIERDSDSGVAVFYLRAQPLDAANATGRRDTRILATLWHDGALLARLSRPLTVVSAVSAANSAQPASSPRAAATTPMAHAMLAVVPMPANAIQAAAVLDPAVAAPDLTIIENRVGDTLRLVFYSASSPPVEADIGDPDALHAWINSHFKQMASRGRAITAEPDPADPADPADAAAQLHAQDYLNGFGAELYDRYAPQAFKELFARMLEQSHGGFSTIQIYSDDPSLPWELMRPMIAKTNQRMDFLGAKYSIARWPVTRRGMMRPPQSLRVEHSAVIAPTYAAGRSLQAANLELTALKKMRGFSEVSGKYAAVRQLAGHLPQGFVHFAGHGAVMDKDGVPQFAILLEDSELDPGTWQALGSAGPSTHPLFFFNACDVGESRQFMNDVDGWAPALLDGGASGYIGALWPVSDTTAELFASTFYDSIAKELALGVPANVAGILTRTRQDVFRKTQDPTALAYVFYGDPKLTLVMAQQ